MQIIFKNNSYIYILPTVDKPVKMVYENTPIKNEKEYLDSIEKVLKNILVYNGVIKNEIICYYPKE